MSTAYNLPTGDFVTTSLNGALTAGGTTATIAGGLNIPATNGILQIDYSSTSVVGATGGPETVTYTSYNTSTGALTGLTRGVAGTTGVAHSNSAPVQAAPSILYLNQDLSNIIQQTAFGTWVPNFTGFAVNNPGAGHYIQLGKIVFAYWISSGSGTSNSTAFTMTLPVAAARQQIFPCARGVDNGSSLTTPPQLQTAASSTTATIYKDLATGAWTNVNGKSVDWFIVYEAA